MNTNRGKVSQILILANFLFWSHALLCYVLHFKTYAFLTCWSPWIWFQYFSLILRHHISFLHWDLDYLWQVGCHYHIRFFYDMRWICTLSSCKLQRSACNCKKKFPSILNATQCTCIRTNKSLIPFKTKAKKYTGLSLHQCVLRK